MERLNPADLVMSRTAAEATLRAAGAEPVPELALTGSLPDGATVVRLFGVLSQVPDDGPVRDLVGPLLALPANAGIARRLADGSLRHLPVNRWVAQQLSSAVLPLKVHLPFTFRPLNSDLAARLERIADEGGVDFRAYFNQGVEFSGDQIALKRVFSLPVRGTSQGTEHDPYVDTVLDDELGVVLEVFAAPG